MKFLVVDDHELARNGLAVVLAGTYEGLELIQAGTVAEGRRFIRNTPGFDLAILDMLLPDGSGLELMDELERHQPEVPLIVVSGDDGYREIVIKKGALGFLPKAAGSAEILDAVSTVLAGEHYFSPTLEPSHGHRRGKGRGGVPEVGLDLTGRQREVLRLVMRGLSNREISQQLDLAESTVKVYVSGLLKAMHVDSRTQAVLTARNMGLAD